MIIGVMGFLLLVSLLTYVAARAGEEGLRRLGRASRGVWMAAIAAPFALLLVPLAMPRGTPASDTATLGTPVVELAPMVVGEAGGLGWGGELAWIVAGLWVGGSLWLAFLLVRTHLALLRERRRWSTSNVAGRRVYVSADRGPAVAGVLRPWIVLPRWVLSLPRAELDYVVLHEEEHLRARDTLLLSTALFFVVLAPWNPVAWLQLRGLKTAMEVDCDRRVLRRAPDRATYGESLLTVAARSSGLSLGLAAFTERRRSLKTRILAMTDHSTRWTPLRSLIFLLVAAAVAVQACYVESPILIIGDDDEVADAVRALVAERGDRERAVESDADVPVEAEPEARPPIVRPEATPPDGPDGETDLPEAPAEVSVEPREGFPTSGELESEDEPRRPASEELARRPTFTPFTVAPRILNREEVVRAMAAEYPPLLREAGIGGTIQVWFFIDEEGSVQNFRIDESSGHEALDRAALAVADVFRFSPALNRDDPVPVWVSFPITFQVR